MAAYEYTATDQNGNKISGIYDGIDNVAALRRDLAKMGDTLLKARRKKSGVSKHGRITQDEIVTFTYKLGGTADNQMPRNARRTNPESFIQAHTFRHQAKRRNGFVAEGRIRKTQQHILEFLPWNARSGRKQRQALGNAPGQCNLP